MYTHPYLRVLADSDAQRTAVALRFCTAVGSVDLYLPYVLARTRTHKESDGIYLILLIGVGTGSDGHHSPHTSGESESKIFGMHVAYPHASARAAFVLVALLGLIAIGVILTLPARLESYGDGEREKETSDIAVRRVPTGQLQETLLTAEHAFK